MNAKGSKFKIELNISGSKAALRLLDDCSGKILETLQWEDRRDLSQKFFQKLERLLRKEKLSLRDIVKFDFDCDSPYFDVEKRHSRIKMEAVNSSGKCGFTAWQTGETIVKVINFAIEK